MDSMLPGRCCRTNYRGRRQRLVWRWPSNATAALGLRELDHHVSCLHHGDRAHPWSQAKLIGCLTGNERNQPIWARLQLDLCHDPVFEHARDDALEMVACRSAHRRFRLDVSGRLRHEARELPPIDDALPTGGPDGGQPTAIGQPANAVDTDAEELC